MFLYESPEESITSISLLEVMRPIVMSVPTRHANGADMAITEGKENSINNATWSKGTRLSRISLTRRSI
jgi:hypothetical protein